MGFGKLASKFHVDRERTARFALDSIALGGEAVPVLLLRYAGDGNAGFENAMAKRRPALQGATRRQSVDLLVEIVSAHVVVGWENVIEDDGTKPEFTSDKAKELLSAIVAGDGGITVFNAILAFAQNPENFRGALPSVEELGKG
jgi:hypothetical protein